MNPLPSIEATAALMSMLVGKSVKVHKGPPCVAAKQKGIATFADAAGELAYVAITDTAFLASSGAALALIPAAVAAESIKANAPSPVLVENAQEVLNIASSLFNEIEGTPLHVKLVKLFLAPPMPPELVALVAKPAGRMDLDVVVPGYPDGKLSFLSIARR